MSLDVELTNAEGVVVYEANITHNLVDMALAAGLYEIVWRPEDLGITMAGQIVESLRAGLTRLVCNPTIFEAYGDSNGWGTYKHFVPFLINYLKACIEHPEATVSVSR